VESLKRDVDPRVPAQASKSPRLMDRVVPRPLAVACVALLLIAQCVCLWLAWGDWDSSRKAELVAGFLVSDWIVYGLLTRKSGPR
jgi:hypothetical protein